MLAHRGDRIEAHPGPPVGRFPLPHGRSVAPTPAGRTLATYGAQAWVYAHRTAASSAPVSSICTLRTEDGATTNLDPLPPTPLALTPHDGAVRRPRAPGVPTSTSTASSQR